MKEIEEQAKENEKTDDSLYITIGYYRLYISILIHKQNNEVGEILNSLSALPASCDQDIKYYIYLLAFAYDLPSDEKEKAKGIAYTPTFEEKIKCLIGDDEIKELAIERKFKAARDKSREKVKAVPAAKDLVLKVLLERVVDAEEASYIKVNDAINEKKYSEAYKHLSIKARTRIISEEEKAILHLLEAIIAMQLFGIASVKTKSTSNNKILSEIAKNNFVIARGRLIASSDRPSKIPNDISNLLDVILQDTTEAIDNPLERPNIISDLLDVILQDTTQAIDNPSEGIMSYIKDVVGDTYNEVCKTQQSHEIELDEAFKLLNIDSQKASYIRLYRAYELFTRALKSSEDPKKLCEKEIAISDDVIVNVIAKYFIETYGTDPTYFIETYGTSPTRKGHSPLTRNQG